VTPLPFPSPSRAYKGRDVSDLILGLMAFSLSQRERGRNTYPCEPLAGEYTGGG
jgi:hypothetical protein